MNAVDKQKEELANLRLITDVNTAVNELTASLAFSHPCIQQFFKNRCQNQPGLKLEGEIKQGCLADGTMLVIGDNGAIAVTFGAENIPYDFEFTFEQRTWLILDLHKCKTFDELKVLIEDIKKPQGEE